ncbi:hypothetical protein CHS0354_042050 [Potamilus streckersoni]|uniref:SKI/SNO/DAC domain-containing protein n=1 Tax=Potamilus streckersoni TaxID=2493646 RepID=A0AAE0TAQ2_9BIVA|nr:hypothetical protein CHS0354_042050 [Potamilus streckersoni]
MEIGGTSGSKTDHLPSPPRAHSRPGSGEQQLHRTGITLGTSAFLNHTPDLVSQLHKVPYSSPPHVTCNPENNMCKLIDYRSAKVAAFTVDGRELICLPQAFELFLKHLVGGLHTVYTKLKRLDITPVVCNVEQVRILRGLGAIQPGVNRCKLISCKEFDILYEDCTNSSARPGRPPKRSPSLHASAETLEKLKKFRFDVSETYYPQFFGDSKNLVNGFPHNPFSIGHLPFMPLNHPMLIPPVPISLASHMGLRSDGAGYMSQSNCDSVAQSQSDGGADRSSHTPHSYPRENTIWSTSHEDNNKPLNMHMTSNEDDLSSISSPERTDNEDNTDDDGIEYGKNEDKENTETPNSPANSDTAERNPHDKNSSAPVANGKLVSFSSIETLLLNIQGLLQVAAKNARHRERQINLEKAELDMELGQVKKQRQEMEMQLAEHQKQRGILQRKYKRERRIRKRLEVKLGFSQRKSLVPATKTPNGISFEALEPNGSSSVHYKLGF